MKAVDLFEIYKSDERTRTIAEWLESPSPSKLHLKGISGSLDALICATSLDASTGIALVILSQEEEATYFFNDLLQLITEEAVFFFPSSYKNSRKQDVIDKANVVRRTEVFDHIKSHNDNNLKKIIIVTYPEALNEKVISEIHLEENSFTLNREQDIDQDTLIDKLFEMGFERTDFIFEPGKFAVRGGIIDVFSYSNDHPYRIEFEGDLISSIRTFDPETQISIKKKGAVNLIPDLQENIAKESMVPFLSLLDSSATVWVKDAKLIDEILTKTKQLTLEEGPYSIFEFGTNFYFKASAAIDFKSKPQPSFNKQFNMLLVDLSEKRKGQFKNIILSDSANQIERLYAIFQDLAEKTNNTKTSIDEDHYTKDSKKPLFEPLILSLHEGFIDHTVKIACYTDHQIFNRYHRVVLKSSFTKKQAITLKEFKDLQKGDYVVHIDHGIGQFAGLEKINVNGKPQEAIRLIYKEGDILYVSIHSLHRISKFAGREGHQPRIDKLGSTSWKKLKQRTKNKVKDIAKDLIKLYAQRKTKKGFQFSPDSYLQTELEASFLSEDTPDQFTATEDVKKDMESEIPMDRLICGDVGFGKTEIAIRAAFKAVTDSKQVAILVPTTILAMQHYNTLRNRLKDFPCNIDYVNRFKSTSQIKQSIENLASGKTDIIIGTHRLVSKDIKFKDIGLLIIDEEQKFGVSTKEKLKSLRVNVDTLTLTATPIPRTLQFSLMSARDLSVINTAPPNRQPIITELHVYNEELIKEAIEHEVSRGGQVFFVHNRVQNIEDIAAMIQRLCPKVRIVTGHGQMDGQKLEKVMINFIDGEYDVLVATTIIESGLDIPNANTIIINNANHHGLSDIHQMRGRVGRSNKQAFCYLLTPPLSTLTTDALKRLRTIEEFSDLGSGFNIAMRDLDIRGAGNLLGAEQSGYINELGFETYHKILDEAVNELKDGEFSNLFKDERAAKNKDSDSNGITSYAKDCQIETDMEILFTDTYINTVTERLSLYKELNDIDNDEDLDKFRTMLTDRFGQLPSQSEALLETIQLRWIAKQCGFEKLVLKQDKMIGYFISNKDSEYYNSEAFSKMLNYVQSNAASCQMKEQKDRLTLVVRSIASIAEAKRVLERAISLGDVVSV
ncbi:MAG: transcription-repair coupling factor [Bacteroidetes bacterium]|nr:MAG: transcription-repair coupling factor [Bacteroidota bacterium]